MSAREGRIPPNPAIATRHDLRVLAAYVLSGALLGAALAGGVHRIVGAALESLNDGDARRREVRFDTRRPVL